MLLYRIKYFPPPTRAPTNRLKPVRVVDLPAQQLDFNAIPDVKPQNAKSLRM